MTPEAAYGAADEGARAGAGGVLVVGTSNTVRRDGYPAFMRTLRPDLALRVEGVGATPSILLPYVLSGTSLAGVSHVVVDTLVNDVVAAAQPGLGESCEAMLFESLDWLRASGRGVILLLLPQTNGGGTAPALRERRLGFCRARGIPALDAAALAEAVAREHRLPEDALFDDPQHIAWPLRLIVAERLLGLIAATPGDGGAALRPWPYRVVPVRAADGAETERGTSLFRARYARMGAGATAVVEGEAGAALLGISINGAADAGELEVEAEGARFREALWRGPAPSDLGHHEMLHVVVPLRRVVTGALFALTAHPRAGGGGDGAMEVEAAVLRDGGPPPGQEAWSAVIAGATAAEEAPVALSPREAAVAQAAAMSRARDLRGPAVRAFRGLVTGPVPFWEMEPARAAEGLAQVGIAIGDAMGARRVLREASRARRGADAAGREAASRAPVAEG